MATKDSLNGREIFLEFKTLGSVVKVTAIDAATGIEASISGPASTPEFILKNNAAMRLEYVLRKEGHID